MFVHVGMLILMSSDTILNSEQNGACTHLNNSNVKTVLDVAKFFPRNIYSKILKVTPKDPEFCVEYEIRFEISAYLFLKTRLSGCLSR